MNQHFTFDSSPNPGKLIESLRHLGYDNYSAIADLIDNSFDALATEVHVKIGLKDKKPFIVIADNGHGMDERTLQQAIKLGSDTIKDPNNDLGKFGMGLCTASLSICRKTSVITKNEDDEKSLKAVNDIDHVVKTNKFESYIGEADKDDLDFVSEFFSEFTSGTVVLLEKCDLISNQNTSVFAQTLKKHLQRIFRFYLSSHKTIYINGESISAYDPLMWNNQETDQYDETDLPIKLKTDDGKEFHETIKIKLAILPKDYSKSDKDNSLNIRNQGFYIMRNNREILDAHTLNLFSKHNDYNRMRGEIQFSGMLDQFMGVNFTKRDISMRQSLHDQLSKHLDSQIKSIRKINRSAKSATAPEEVSKAHDGASKEIRRKSKLLVTPKAPKELRSSDGSSCSNKSKNDHENNRIRQPNENRKQVGGFTADCEFLAVSMSPEGPVYDASKQGRKIIIRYNSDHPFYQRFIVDSGARDSDFVVGIDYLIYSLACAELSQNDEDEEIAMLLSNLKAIMSSNLKTLLH